MRVKLDNDKIAPICPSPSNNGAEFLALLQVMGCLSDRQAALKGLLQDIFLLIFAMRDTSAIEFLVLLQVMGCLVDRQVFLKGLFQDIFS